MTRHKPSAIDQCLAAELTEVEKIRALMTAREGSVGRWAINRAFFPEQVHMCLSGARPYPQIRTAIAKFVAMDQSVIDDAIGAVAA